MQDEIAKILSEYPEFDPDTIREVNETVVVVNFLQTFHQDTNEPFWALIAVPIFKLIDFRKAQTQGIPYSLKDYGEVLAYGEGAEPSEEEAKELVEKYQINLNFQKEAVEEFGKFKARKAEEKKEKSLMDKINQMKAKKDEN